MRYRLMTLLAAGMMSLATLEQEGGPGSTSTSNSPSDEQGGGATEAGGGGDTTVAGGAGADTVTGGGGADTVSSGGADDQAAAAAEAARAIKPDKADGFALNLSDKAKAGLGDMTNDPALAAVREHALAKGWTQGEFDDRIGETLNVLAEKGLLAPAFDPAAELAKLGEGGKAKQEDLQVFAKNLLERKEITADEYEEFMSLVPTAAGTLLLGKMRRMMGAAGEIKVEGTPAETKDQLMERARNQRRDPRYNTDPQFQRETDELRKRAFAAS